MGNDHEAFNLGSDFPSIVSKSERNVLQIGEGGNSSYSLGRWPDLFKNQQESNEVVVFFNSRFWTHFGRGEV